MTKYILFTINLPIVVLFKQWDLASGLECNKALIYKINLEII